MSDLNLEIVTPSRRLAQVTCREVYMPGVAGEFGVLSEHAPLVSLLSPGVVRYQEGGEQKRLAIRSGFVHVLSDHVILLADEALFPTEVKPAEVRKRRDELEAKMISADVNPEDRANVISELRWLDAQISVSEQHT